MAALGAIVCQAIVHHYGRDESSRAIAARALRTTWANW
jgi:hypothetical protein